MSLPKIVPLPTTPFAERVKILDEGNQTKVDNTWLDEKLKISKIGDYSAANQPDINLFEILFYIGGKEYYGLQEGVARYELDDEVDEAKGIKVEFHVPKGLEIDLKDLFTEHGKVDLRVIRFNRMGRCVAMRLFENCKLTSSTKEFSDGYRNPYNPYCKEVYGFSFGE